MNFSGLEYTNENRAAIRGTVDGKAFFAPIGSRLYRKAIASGVAISAYSINTLKAELKQTVRARAKSLARKTQDNDKRTRALAQAVKIFSNVLKDSLTPQQRGRLKTILDVFDVDIKAVDDKAVQKIAEIDALTTAKEIKAYDAEDFS